MKVVSLLVALLSTVFFGCQTNDARKTTEFEARKNAVFYNPSGKEQFIFNELLPNLQLYGYFAFTKNPLGMDCLKTQLSYQAYVGKKGYFETNFPTHENVNGFQIYPVVIETGERAFYCVNPAKGKYNEFSLIIPLVQFDQLRQFKAMPLVPGSSIFVVSNMVAGGSIIYKLSNDRNISEESLRNIHELTAKFGGNPSVANSMVEATIIHDPVEGLYTISSEYNMLRSGVFPVIYVNDDGFLLSFRAQFITDDKFIMRGPESLKIVADGIRKEYTNMRFKGKVFGKSSMFHSDSQASEADLEVLELVGDADQSIVRFVVNSQNKDVYLDSQQKKGINDIIRIFEAMEMSSEKTKIDDNGGQDHNKLSI